MGLLHLRKISSEESRYHAFHSVRNEGYRGWAELGRRNGIENQSQSSGRHTKFLNGIETVTSHLA